MIVFFMKITIYYLTFMSHHFCFLILSPFFISVNSQPQFSFLLSRSYPIPSLNLHDFSSNQIWDIYLGNNIGHATLVYLTDIIYRSTIYRLLILSTYFDLITILRYSIHSQASLHINLRRKAVNSFSKCITLVTILTPNNNWPSVFDNIFL